MYMKHSFQDIVSQTVKDSRPQEMESPCGKNADCLFCVIVRIFRLHKRRESNSSKCDDQLTCVKSAHSQGRNPKKE